MGLKHIEMNHSDTGWDGGEGDWCDVL